MLFGNIEPHTKLHWECLPTGLSSGNNINSSCKNWTNFAWKPMITLGSISKKSSNFMINRSCETSFKLARKYSCSIHVSSVLGGMDLLLSLTFSYGAVELKDEHTKSTFQVNGHQIKLFHEGPTIIAGDMETIFLMELAPPDDTP
ncbi:hypothetical protein CR513_21237, partial [Mucuna pruriens]